MLAQGGLGLPNMAAVEGDSAGLQLFVNQNTVFAPIAVIQSPIPVTPNLVINVSSFPVPQLQWSQTITLSGMVENENRIPSPGLIWDNYVYTYPIGRYPDSDYGIRSAKTFYKRRLIIGRH